MLLNNYTAQGWFFCDLKSAMSQFCYLCLARIVGLSASAGKKNITKFFSNNFWIMSVDFLIYFAAIIMEWPLSG